MHKKKHPANSPNITRDTMEENHLKSSRLLRDQRCKEARKKCPGEGKKRWPVWFWIWLLCSTIFSPESLLALNFSPCYCSHSIILILQVVILHNSCIIVFCNHSCCLQLLGSEKAQMIAEVQKLTKKKRIIN